MFKIDSTIAEDREVFVGIDVSKRSYAVMIRADGQELYGCKVAAAYPHLRALWARLPGCRIHAVYEAGFSGFGLHDQLIADGIDSRVTPPSKIPRSHDRVKATVSTFTSFIDCLGTFLGEVCPRSLLVTVLDEACPLSF